MTFVADKYTSAQHLHTFTVPSPYQVRTEKKLFGLGKAMVWRGYNDGSRKIDSGSGSGDCGVWVGENVQEKLEQAFLYALSVVHPMRKPQKMVNCAYNQQLIKEEHDTEIEDYLHKD